MDERILDDRDLRLGEDFPDLEVALDREGRSALAGEVTRRLGLERLVRIEFQGFLAPLDARVDRDAVLCPGSLNAGFTKKAGHVRVEQLLRSVALDDTEDVQIIDRRRRRPRRPK